MTPNRPFPRVPAARLWLTLPVLLLVSSPAPAVLGATVPGAHPSSSGSAQWAYGGNRSIDLTGAARNGSFALSSHVGYQVLFNATTGANGEVVLSSARTMGAVERISYCTPSCKDPTIRTSIDFHAVERLTGITNLTPHATVQENGTAVAALGIDNATTQLRVAEFENDSVAYGIGARARVGTANLSLLVEGAIGASFSPALGVVPGTLAPGLTWSASAMFAGSGSWRSTTTFHRTNLLGVSLSGGNTVESAANHSGNVSLRGRDLGTLALGNGATSQVLGLLLTGPLTLREGILLLPDSADAFGPAPSASPPGGNASLGESLSGIDYSTSSSTPIGLLASSATFTAQSSDPGPSAAAGLGPASAAETSGPLEVQAQPESVSGYAQSSNCLTTESCTGGSPGTGGVAPGLRPLLGIGIAVAAVVAVLASALVVARRPRVPPRGNAPLYPPVGATTRTSEPRQRPTGRPPAPEPSEPDPLDHLW